MNSSYRLSNQELKEAKELTNKLQDTLISIQKDTLKQISVAMGSFTSFPQDYFKKITEEYARTKQAYQAATFFNVNSAVKTLQDSLSSAAKALQDSFISQSLKINKDFQEINNIIKTVSKILFDLGWWIQPEWSIPSLVKIVKSHKAGKDNEIGQEIIAYFDNSKLDEITSNWGQNKKLSQRIDILKDAVWAHKQGKYTLSIPALIPHVEGIINENSGKKGKIKFSECLTIFNDDISKKSYIKPTSSLYPLALLKFCENLLKENFEWGKPSNKGRHPILHGHNVNYSDRVFSLKLILLIDFIQKIIC
jgi:hypothetical protein